MTIPEYLASVIAERQDTLLKIHEIIIANDPSIAPVAKPLMGKDAILYEDHGYMKYGLADTKKHISLHCLPMYMVPALHVKFQAILPAAQFQKGCINFSNAEEMPLEAVTDVIVDCAAVNIVTILESRKKK